MARFIVRRITRGDTPDRAVAPPRPIEGMPVLEVTPRMLLVEGIEEAVRSAFDAKHWIVEPEVRYDIPDPGPRIRRPPE
jgi:hypothetical protein